MLTIVHSLGFSGEELIRLIIVDLDGDRNKQRQGDNKVKKSLNN